MHYLILSIVASTAVLAIFKLMQHSKADNRHTIMLSYATAALPGFALFSLPENIVKAPWFFPAAIEGIAFYVVFRAIAKTTQTNGLAVTSIAAKMSVVIPISIGLIFLGEEAGTLITIGVVVGLASILLTAGGGAKIGDWKWPLFVFLGSGLIDASFKLVQVLGLSESEFPGFITIVFLFAFFAGLLHHFLLKDKKINSHSIIASVFLGLANFGTVYFLLNALAIPKMDSSVVYALNNFGIVALSTLIAVVLFREMLNVKGWLGMVLAGVSIALIYGGSI